MVAKQAGVHPPNGLDPAYERAVGSTLPLHRIAGALARVRALSLDRALIAGSSPAASHQLTARAAVLTSRRFRTSLADGLERMLQAAAQEPGRLRLRPCRQVLVNASTLLGLAELLRSAAPLYASGVALVHRLLADGTGPAYTGEGAELVRLLAEARVAMRAGEAIDIAGARRPGSSPGRGPQIAFDPVQQPRGGPR